jgi:hypothetical protein
MPITPFIESKTVKDNIPVKSRPGTIVPPEFRQGNEITVQTYQARGLYTISTGLIKSQVVISNFGSVIADENNTPFVDTARLTAITEINENLWLQEEPQARFDNADVFDENGIIEPLTIRSVVNFTNISGNEVAHGIKGTLLDGNLDLKNNSDRITQIKTIKNNSEPFLDSQDYFGSLLLKQVRWDDIRQNNSFVESDHIEKSIVISENMESDLKDAITNMNPISDTFLSSNETSSTAGFIFDNAVLGTDSIAFL